MSWDETKPLVTDYVHEGDDLFVNDKKELGRIFEGDHSYQISGDTITIDVNPTVAQAGLGLWMALWDTIASRPANWELHHVWVTVTQLKNNENRPICAARIGSPYQLDDYCQPYAFGYYTMSLTIMVSRGHWTFLADGWMVNIPYVDPERYGLFVVGGFWGSWNSHKQQLNPREFFLFPEKVDIFYFKKGG